MDDHQSVKMINWLDEERRKDKVLIAQLEATNAAQQELIEDHLRRIQALESELTQLRERAVHEANLKQMFDGLRAEIQDTMERDAEKRRTAEREAKKQREVDREGMTRAVEQMRQELLARFERDLGPRMAFEERINSLAAEVEESAKVLHHEAESGQRSLEFLEEQRRIDSRRITELQEEMVEGQKRIDSLLAKIDLVEALARRNERFGADIQDLRQRQEDWTENQETVAQQRERMLTEMQGRIDAFAKQMESYGQQVTGWGETHARLKKYLEDAERIAERVDRRVNEVSEMARLSEERFRQEWETFVKDDHKRWRQFTLTASEAWREHDRHAEEESKRVVELREFVQRHEEMLNKFFAMEREYASMVGDHLQAMMDEIYNNHAKNE
jgi:chromosome segregation ATPase